MIKTIYTPTRTGLDQVFQANYTAIETKGSAMVPSVMYSGENEADFQMLKDLTVTDPNNYFYVFDNVKNEAWYKIGNDRNFISSAYSGRTARENRTLFYLDFDSNTQAAIDPIENSKPEKVKQVKQKEEEKPKEVSIIDEINTLAKEIHQKKKELLSLIDRL